MPEMIATALLLLVTLAVVGVASFMVVRLYRGGQQP